MLVTSNGCKPEGFDVAACSLSGKLAFQIHKIDGWFSDYQPRPSSVIVLAEGEGPDSKWPGKWAAELKYHSDRESEYDRRPPRILIVYGQQLPGWEVAQQAKLLEPSTAYWFSVQDNGRDGSVRFMPKTPLKSC
jgi:hypothetical protein